MQPIASVGSPLTVVLDREPLAPRAVGRPLHEPAPSGHGDPGLIPEGDEQSSKAGDAVDA